MDLFSTILSFSFIIFSLLVSGIVFSLRKLVEFIWKNAINNKLWENIILPIIPILIGAGLAYVAKMYPYGAGFTTLSGRVAFGAVAGLLSGFLYRLAKAMITQKLQSLGVTSDDSNEKQQTMGSDLHLDP